MPKLTVYVSDDLWDRAVHVLPDTKASQLVQRALNTLIEQEESSMATAVAVEDPEIEVIKARLIREAQELYRDGYRAGIALAGQLSWAWLERGRQRGWSDIELLGGGRWSTWNPHEALAGGLSVFEGRVMGVEGQLVSEAAGKADNSGSVYQHGFKDALEHIHRSVKGAKLPGTNISI